MSSRVVQGTIFSQPFHHSDNPTSHLGSQPYLAHVATRGIVIIDTEVEEIGLVVFIPIGMVDVCSVDLSIISYKNRICKGEEIGCFHFGGSSYLMIFERKANINLEFDLQGIELGDSKKFLNVNSKLATAH